MILIAQNIIAPRCLEHRANMTAVALYRRDKVQDLTCMCLAHHELKRFNYYYFFFLLQEDMKHLLRDAAEGLLVAQRKITWESERPTVKAVGDATKLRGFVEYGRQSLPYRPVEDRLQDYGEVLGRLPQQDQEELLHTQAARCMDCGTPFCHQTSSGVHKSVRASVTVCLSVRVSLSVWVCVNVCVVEECVCAGVWVCILLS